MDGTYERPDGEARAVGAVVAVDGGLAECADYLRLPYCWYQGRIVMEQWAADRARILRAEVLRDRLEAEGGGR